MLVRIQFLPKLRKFHEKFGKHFIKNVLSSKFVSPELLFLDTDFRRQPSNTGIVLVLPTTTFSNIYKGLIFSKFSKKTIPWTFYNKDINFENQIINLLLGSEVWQGTPVHKFSSFQIKWSVKWNLCNPMEVFEIL